jgi:hypothetical protein
MAVQYSSSTRICTSSSTVIVAGCSAHQLVSHPLPNSVLYNQSENTIY